MKGMAETKMKILIIQQKMIGDVLTSSILFEAIKREHPRAELHYLIYSFTVPVILHNPYIDKIIRYDDSNKNPINFFSFLNKIRKENYESVIDIYAKLDSAIISRYSKAGIRVSYKKWYTQLFYTNCFSRNITAQTSAGPAIEKRLRLLAPILKNIPKEIKPKIYLTDDENLKAEQHLNSEGIKNNKPLLMISVLGSTKDKTFPLKYLAEILDRIASVREVQFLFNYIPNQKKDVLKVYEICNPHTRKSIFLKVFGSNLREFLALTAQCDALIGNEGGAVNMAKALNVPTFAIFSPGVPKENWSIYENGTTNVSVHLNDYKPELFKKYSNKEIKQRSQELYDLFHPSYFDEKLLKFLNTVSK